MGKQLREIEGNGYFLIVLYIQKHCLRRLLAAFLVMDLGMTSVVRFIIGSFKAIAIILSTTKVS